MVTDEGFVLSHQAQVRESLGTHIRPTKSQTLYGQSWPANESTRAQVPARRAGGLGLRWDQALYDVIDRLRDCFSN